jgi:hypothetical protein
MIGRIQALMEAATAGATAGTMADAAEDDTAQA